jgi:hypothetical protein
LELQRRGLSPERGEQGIKRIYVDHDAPPLRKEALQVTNQDVMNVLGRMPPVKVLCSLLAEQAIRAAVEDYRDKTKPTSDEPDLDESGGLR